MHSFLCVDSEDRDIASYPSACKYRISFPPIQRVISINLIGSVFTHSANVVTSDNNKIYWQNGREEPDHATVYEAKIPEGSYTYTTFTKTLTEAMNSVKHKQGHQHDFRIETHRNTETISFDQFGIKNKALIFQDDGVFKSLYHPDHGLKSGQQICISSCKISEINGMHKVSIIDVNSYKIETSDVTCFNSSVSLKVQSVICFRLLPLENNMNELLGISSQAFKTSHDNSSGKMLNLSGDSYYYLKCPQLSRGTTSSNLKNVFAKISLNGPVSSVLFNSCSSTLTEFQKPLDLNFLDFEIVDCKGKLIKCRDCSHSFVFEVIHAD